MNQDVLQDILYNIRHNRVKGIDLTEPNYKYELYGKNNKLLMSMEIFDSELPRAIIYIGKKHFTHINHLAKTEEQFRNNAQIWQILYKISLKYAQQLKVTKTRMTKKELAISSFLHNNSSRGI